MMRAPATIALAHAQAEFLSRLMDAAILWLRDECIGSLPHRPELSYYNARDREWSGGTAYGDSQISIQAAAGWMDQIDTLLHELAHLYRPECGHDESWAYVYVELCKWAGIDPLSMRKEQA